MGRLGKEPPILEIARLPLPDDGRPTLPDVQLFWLHREGRLWMNWQECSLIEPYPPLDEKAIPAFKGQVFIQTQGPGPFFLAQAGVVLCHHGKVSGLSGAFPPNFA
jgi:hypothetical protein